MAPAKKLGAQLFGDGVALNEKRQHRASKAPGKQRLGHRRQGDKPAIGQERSVGGEHRHVRVEVGQTPEGLHEQDQPRARAGCGLGVRLKQPSRGDAA